MSVDYGDGTFLHTLSKKVKIEVGKVRTHADRAAGFFDKKSIYDFLSYFQFQTDLFSFFQKIIAYSNSHNVKKTLT